MARKIFPLSPEIIGPLGLGLIPIQQPFVEMLRKATPTNFGSQLLSTLRVFVFMLLFIVPLFVCLTAKIQHLEFLQKGRAERRRIGYWRYAFFIWLFALGIDTISFVVMKLILSWPLFYGQTLVIALVAATCATLFHLLYIGFLDMWVRSSATPSVSAVEQKNHLAKGKK